MLLTPDNQRWLDAFRARHGRSPRILHIGNIANNAYINAKLLNQAGFDCDVICYDYYHIMGCPEWEDGIFDGGYGDHFKPDWAGAGVRNFERPDWFAQGPLRECIEYLIAKRSGGGGRGNSLRLRLRALNGSLSATRPSAWERISSSYARFTHRAKRVVRFFLTSSGGATRIARQCDEGRIAAAVDREILRIAAAWALLSVALAARLTLGPILMSLRFANRLREPSSRQEACLFDVRVRALVAAFAEHFPQRPDAMCAADLEVFRGIFDDWRRLLKNYDLVHAYATDPIIPLLAGVPYVAFEHGTIRNIPFEGTPQGRMCALSYRCSDWAVITNADNLSSARRLGIERFTFVPHPVNENGISDTSAAQKLRQELGARLGAMFLVFHPSRQHWSDARHPDWEKGNDIFLRGFARFVHETNGGAAAVLVDWGATVEESRRLIDELGIAEKIIWVQPMPHLKMIEYIMACDLVADQFFLGAFGSTLPKALACGRPTMLYLDEAIHKECFEEMPPVLNARTEIQVFEQLYRLWTNPAGASELQRAGRSWYEKFHSNRTIANKLTCIYASALRGRSESLSGEAVACAA